MEDAFRYRRLDAWAAARAARQRKIAAQGGPKPSDSGVSHSKYAARSTHPNAPYASLMRATDARVAAALARVGPADGPCRRRGPQAARSGGLTIVEHRATGERRVYPLSPIGQPIMDCADVGPATGDLCRE